MAERQESSAGGVVFRKRDAGVEVALGEQRDRLTGEATLRLPKGKPDPGESPEQTALREVLEETGIAARIVAPLPTVHYVYRQGEDAVDKTVHFFLMESVDEAAGVPDGELARVVWLAPDDALARLTCETERDVMARARAELTSCCRERSSATRASRASRTVRRSSSTATC